MNDEERIRVMVVDDHPLFRDGARAMLEGSEDALLVAEAESGEEAVRLALELQPDVVLMDLRLPGMNGIEAARQILRNSPRIGVVMVTMFDEDSSVFAAMRVGARGYVVKGADKEELLRAIRATANGEALFSPDIARRMTNYFTQLAEAGPAQIFPELTSREREVLDLIARGLSNQQIADRLGISGKTVRNHIGNIFDKLQVADRAQAVIRARDAGLGGAR
jgi:DNA-binding NarL/FixJ family response regulator